MKLNFTPSLFRPSPEVENYSVFTAVADFLSGAHKPFTRNEPHDADSTNNTQVPVIHLVPMRPLPEHGTEVPPVWFDVEFIRTKKWCYISPMISDGDVVFWRKMMSQRVINGTLISHPSRHEFVKELNELLEKHNL